MSATATKYPKITPEIVADTPLEDLEVVFRGPPAIHRYPASMAKRTQELARAVIDDYDPETRTFTLKTPWTTQVNGTSRFEISQSITVMLAMAIAEGVIIKACRTPPVCSRRPFSFRGRAGA